MRAVNRALSLLLGLALLGGGVLTAVESVLVVLDRSPWVLPTRDWYASLTGTRLGDSAVLVASLVLALVGLVLLAAELRPAPSSRLPLELGWTGASLERRSAQRRLAAAANEVRGVHGAHARVRVRRGQWRVRMAVRVRDEDRDGVQDRLWAELAHLHAPEPVDLQLRVREPEEVS